MGLERDRYLVVTCELDIDSSSGKIQESELSQMVTAISGSQKINQYWNQLRNLFQMGEATT